MKTQQEKNQSLFPMSNEQFLKGLEIYPWTKSLLPCHIHKDDQRYNQYLDLMELMQMPEIEKMILEKLAELKISARYAINQFFAGLKEQQ